MQKGQLYSDLKESIIIFIATKDLIGYNLPRYTFSNICHENTKIKLNDKTVKVIYNLKGDLSILSESEQDLLKYMADGTANSGFTKKIEKLVNILKEKENYRTNYMTWEMESRRLKAEGRKEGIAQGAHDKAIEDARSFYANGVSIEIIAKSLNMSTDEITRIVNGEDLSEN